MEADLVVGDAFLAVVAPGVNGLGRIQRDLDCVNPDVEVLACRNGTSRIRSVIRDDVGLGS